MVDLEKKFADTEDSPVTITNFSIALHPEDDWILAGDLLQDDNWLSRVCGAFDPKEKLLQAEIGTELSGKATLLCNILRTRMRSDRFMDRIKPSRRSHWCLGWAFENMSIPAAFMVFFMQVKKNIAVLNEFRCLLSKPNGNNFFMATNEEGKLFGCYLAYDTNYEEHVRSGKSTNAKGGCAARWEEHKKNAEDKTNNTGCLFYDLYPSKKSPRSKGGDNAGEFEDLVQYIPAGFDGNAVAKSGIFAKEYHEGGIFSTRSVRKKILSALSSAAEKRRKWRSIRRWFRTSLRPHSSSHSAAATCPRVLASRAVG